VAGKVGRPRKVKDPVAGVAMNDAPQSAPATVSEALAQEAPTIEETKAPRARRARKDVEPAPVYDWAPMGVIFKQLCDPLYKAAGVGVTDLPPIEAWEAFAKGWGGVVTYYFPISPDSPWPAAVVGTLLISAPLLKVYASKPAAPRPVMVRPVAPAPAPHIDPARPAPPDQGDDVSNIFLGTRRAP
jgi:hypothetical protein